MTHINPGEVLETLKRREDAYRSNLEIQLDYWMMVCPEFAQQETLDFIDSTAIAASKFLRFYRAKGLPTDASAIGTSLDMFIKGVEFGRELERMANARI